MKAVQKAMRPTRIKAPQVLSPQNLEEANRFIAVIGREQRAIDEAVLACEEKIEQLKEELAKEIAPYVQERKSFFEGLFAFATANKARLTVESKTVVLLAGKFLWRWTPPAVAVADDEEMIARLKSLGKGAYVRKIEELDREALLADRAKLKIPGLRFTQREEFVVVPDGIDAKSELKKTRTIDADQTD